MLLELRPAHLSSLLDQELRDRLGTKEAFAGEGMIIVLLGLMDDTHLSAVWEPELQALLCRHCCSWENAKTHL